MLDRTRRWTGRRLGAFVFADADRRQALEAIIHPRVRARAAEIEAAAPQGTLVVHDIPLLAETGQAGASTRSSWSTSHEDRRSSGWCGSGG